MNYTHRTFGGTVEWGAPAGWEQVLSTQQWYPEALGVQFGAAWAADYGDDQSDRPATVETVTCGKDSAQGEGVWRAWT